MRHRGDTLSYQRTLYRFIDEISESLLDSEKDEVSDVLDRI